MNKAQMALHQVAPELLEALKECVACFKLDSGMEKDFSPEIKKAEKAIAKAEGRNRSCQT